MQNKIRIIGIILFLVLIVGVSGCTSQTTDPTQDIYIVNEPISVGANGPPGEWYVDAELRSKTNKAYSNITVELTGYSKNNKVLASKNVTVGYLQAGYGESAIGILKSNAAIDHATAKIINATPE